MPAYNFQLNGSPVQVDSWDPAQPLLYVLRNRANIYLTNTWFCCILESWKAKNHGLLSKPSNTLLILKTA